MRRLTIIRVWTRLGLTQRIIILYRVQIILQGEDRLEHIDQLVIPGDGPVEYIPSLHRSGQHVLYFLPPSQIPAGLSFESQLDPSFLVNDLPQAILRRAGLPGLLEYCAQEVSTPDKPALARTWSI